MLVFLYELHSEFYDESIFSDDSTVGQARTVGTWTKRPKRIRVPEKHELATSSGSIPMDLFRYELIGRLYKNRWFWPPHEEYKWINGFLMCLQPELLVRLDEKMGLKNGRNGPLRRALIPTFTGKWQHAWAYIEKEITPTGIKKQKSEVA